tara:strand:+ start:935 stop:1129 length:195 start_codon:yes stop_codon:yes gene_type:complete
MGQVAKAGAAVLFGDSDAQQTQVAKPRPKVSGELVTLVNLLGPWCNLLGGELAYCVPDEVNGLT